MKPVGLISTGILLLLLGTIAPGYAQREQQEKEQGKPQHPWPEMWTPTWYETDDVYLDYTDDGYYLYDRMYPGIGVAVTISF